MVVREPAWVRWLRDSLKLSFFLLIVGAMAVPFVFLPARHAILLDLPMRIVAAMLTQLLLLAILRELLPKPTAGSHLIAFKAPFLRWLVSSAFASVALLPLLRGPYWWLSMGQLLYLRILGAKLSVKTSLCPHMELGDPALVTIGAGAQLEPGVILETADFGAGRVRVAPVHIGPGCLIGTRSLLMPGASVADDSRLGPNVVIGASSKVGVGASLAAGVNLDANVTLGSYVSIGPAAILADGSRVGDRARIAAASWVPADSQISDRERWAGNPATHQEPNPASPAEPG